MDTLSLSKKLLDVIGHTIEKEGGSLVHDEAYWNSVLDRCVEQGIQGLTAEAARLEELISGLEAAGRRVTLLKGHSVSCFWPNAALRPQGDIDLWLDDSDAGDVYFKSSGIEVKACRDRIDCQYLSSALRESGLDRFNDLVIAVLEQCLDIDFPDLFATGNRFTAREKARVFRDILSSKKQLPT